MVVLCPAPLRKGWSNFINALSRLHTATQFMLTCAYVYADVITSQQAHPPARLRLLPRQTFTLQT